MPTGWRLLSHHDKCAVQQRDVHLHIYAFSSVAVPICLESKGLIVNLSIFSIGFHYVASNKIKTPGNTYISPANQACYLLLDWWTHIKGTSFINGTHVRWSYRKMLGHRCIKNPVGKMGSITIEEIHSSNHYSERRQMTGVNTACFRPGRWTSSLNYGSLIPILYFLDLRQGHFITVSAV